jgi:hypothetical protein
VRGVRRPTAHPPLWAYDVVRASYRLPAEAKHVWRIINEFDRTAGCWASLALLAQLTGMPCDRFSAHVDTLQGLGLVSTVTQGTRVILFATLPNIGFPADAKLERQDKIYAADRLDHHIANRGAATPQVELKDSPHETSAPRSYPQTRETAVPLKSSPGVNCSPEVKAVSGQHVEPATASPERESTSKASPANGNGGYPGRVAELVSDVVDKLTSETLSPDDKKRLFRAQVEASIRTGGRSLG